VGHFFFLHAQIEEFLLCLAPLWAKDPMQSNVLRLVPFTRFLHLPPWSYDNPQRNPSRFPLQFPEETGPFCTTVHEVSWLCLPLLRASPVCVVFYAPRFPPPPHKVCRFFFCRVFFRFLTGTVDWGKPNSLSLVRRLGSFLIS